MPKITQWSPLCSHSPRLSHPPKAWQARQDGMGLLTRAGQVPPTLNTPGSPSKCSPRPLGGSSGHRRPQHPPECSPPTAPSPRGPSRVTSLCHCRWMPPPPRPPAGRRSSGWTSPGPPEGSVSLWLAPPRTSPRDRDHEPTLALGRTPATHRGSGGTDGPWAQPRVHRAPINVVGAHASLSLQVGLSNPQTNALNFIVKMDA